MVDAPTPAITFASFPHFAQHQFLYIPHILSENNSSYLMKKFSQNDERFLEAAEGWLGLGDCLSANEELDQITPELKADSDVLTLRLQIYWAAKQWVDCVTIARAVIELDPGNDYAWIGRSFALPELKRTEEAQDLLLPAKDKFPKNWTIPYNLACYSAQLNQLDEAEYWFKKAMKMVAHPVKQRAIADPDLPSLLDGRSGTMWKKIGRDDAQSWSCC